MDSDINKLALGTAQFGLNYGISNSTGIVKLAETRKIVDYAISNNIKTFDTAHTYGNCHKILGEILEDKNVDIITKTPNAAETDAKQIYDGMIESLRDLKRNSVSGLLLHMTNIFKNDMSPMLKALVKIKSEGLVKKIGVSVYTPKEVSRVLNEMDIDIIQVPCGIFNQDFLLSGTIQKLKSRGVEVHIRSIFLQGLVFIEPDKLHDYFSPIKKHIIEFHDFLRRNNISPLMAAVNFVKNIEDIDKIVVGAQTKIELEEIIKAYDCDIQLSNFERWSFSSEHFYNPSMWKIY